MSKLLLPVLTLLWLVSALHVQAQTNPRPLRLEEYQKAKAFQIKDLDADTYVKIENAYILDRYELRKPYFITGDDGLRKRMDLYRLLAKEGLQELGLMVFYTNEKGKRYQALLPNFTSDGKVWEQYFEDIHAIDREEKNFVLKLSYILSKELAFQQYKVLNQGKDLKVESATYGNDICFPGTQEVALENGSKKLLKDIRPGDRVVTVDPETKQATVTQVQELVAHEAKNYAITQLVVVAAQEKTGNTATEVLLSGKVLEATPNHPMLTRTGQKKIGEILEGEEVLCFNQKTRTYEPFTVLRKKEYAGGVQKVYNMVATEGTTFLMNGVMVLQK
ncbi:Hint domain-containing protein [Rufibacter aurantiacus]|uniref:Hint domain-containing protein n=1 Tax=Rufibacter aurantiacus TaxID=2817374 RepID=UPI001B30FD19|nr:Hint domain-containing protein [Rufibacter aurantiacus]